MKDLMLKFGAGLLVFGWLILPLQTVLAQNNAEDACRGAGGTFADGKCSFQGEGTLESGFKNVVNGLIFIVGAIAVLMLIIGAIRFAISGGDPEAAKGARNTILYAVIAIVVAIMAFAIVNFVIGQVQN
jgi:hypothetical protein